MAKTKPDTVIKRKKAINIIGDLSFHRKGEQKVIMGDFCNTIALQS